MSDQPKEVFIMGPPVSRSAQRKIGMLDYRPPEGAQKELCVLCEKHYWVGPRQLEAIRAAPATVTIRKVCFCCVKQAGFNPKETPVMHLGGKGGSYVTTSGVTLSDDPSFGQHN